MFVDATRFIILQPWFLYTYILIPLLNDTPVGLCLGIYLVLHMVSGARDMSVSGNRWNLNARQADFRRLMVRNYPAVLRSTSGAQSVNVVSPSLSKYDQETGW